MGIYEITSNAFVDPVTFDEIADEKLVTERVGGVEQHFNSDTVIAMVNSGTDVDPLTRQDWSDKFKCDNFRRMISRSRSRMPAHVREGCELMFNMTDDELGALMTSFHSLYGESGFNLPDTLRIKTTNADLTSVATNSLRANGSCTPATIAK